MPLVLIHEEIMTGFLVRYAPILTATLYGFVSTSITLFNKLVLGTYEFHFANLMTLYQILLSLVFLQLLKYYKFIEFAPFEMARAKKITPLAISFIGMVLTGLSALDYLNVPMFNALRRMTVLCTMWCEAWVLGIYASKPIKAAVYAMVVGGFVAAFYDLDFNAMGYFMVALNSAFTAAYLICIAKFGKGGLDTFGLLFYNNIISLPLVIIVCFINGDFVKMWAYEHLYSLNFWTVFTISSLQAFLLNYSIFLCTNTNSALATSVVGQIKNIATTAIGYVGFTGVTYNFPNVFGLVVGILASVVYSWFQFVEAESKKKPVVPPKDVELSKESDNKDVLIPILAADSRDDHKQ